MNLENKKTLQIAIESDVPAMIWGAPGIGKTAVIADLAKKSGKRLITLIGSTLDPAEACGIMMPADGAVVTVPPDWAKQAQKDRKNTWLFFDELSCAPGAVQAALLRVINERRVGDLDLSNVAMIAAGNPAESAADNGWLAPAAANRWAHIDAHIDAAQWVRGCRSGWGKAWPRQATKSVSQVTGFIQRNPSALLQTEIKDGQNAYPTPRSWTHAIKMITAGGEMAEISACVGSSAAAEFLSWRAENDLPDPEDLLAGRAKLPARGDQVHAALGALVVAASADHADKKNRIKAAWDILSKVRDDIAINPAQSLLDVDDICNHKRAIELGEKIVRVQA